MINENVRLIRPETIELINHLVVAEGHRLHPEAVEYVRGDTFVSQTNIHYPTESGLMLDGLSKICDLAPRLASSVGSVGWRQSKSLFKKAKKALFQPLKLHFETPDLFISSSSPTSLDSC